MTQARIKRFANRYLLPRMPGWVLGHHAVMRRQHEALLLLIHFDSSAFDRDSMNIRATVFPLFLGYESVALNFSRTLFRPGRGGWRLSGGDELLEKQVGEEVLDAIRKIGLPFIQRIATLDRFVDQLPIMRRETQDDDEDWQLDRVELEALAGGEILLGRPRVALQHIRALLDMLATLTYPWAVATRELWVEIEGRMEADWKSVQMQFEKRIITAAAKLQAPPATPVFAE